MKVGSKHSKEFSGILTRFLGGLNKALPPHAIGDDELIDATNMYYAPDTGYLRTRPPLKQNSAGTALGGEINGVYEYVKNGTPYILLTTTETPQKLYTMDVNTRAMTYVGDLTGTKRPSFSTENDLCLIASGGTLQSFDGTTLSVITSPTVAPAMDFITDLSEKDTARVIGCGSATYRDRALFSGVKDGTYWTFNATPETDAKYIDVGYKDGMDLIGIGVFQGDAIMFKRSSTGSKRAIYRGIVKGASTDWSCPQYRRLHSTLSPHLIAERENGLLFVDIEGPKLLTMSSQPLETAPYDISPAGKAVAGEIAASVANDGFIITDPIKMVTMIKPTKNGERFYCLDFIGNRWTYFAYGLNIQSGAYVGGKMLLGASNGHVYEYDADSAVNADGGTAYTVTAETKWFNVFQLFNELVKEKYLDLVGLSDGTGTITIKQKGALLYSVAFAFSQGWWEWSVVNAITPEEWTEDLEKSPMFETEITEVVEGDFMSIAVSITSGQCALSHLAARIAQTGRNMA